MEEKRRGGKGDSEGGNGRGWEGRENGKGVELSHLFNHTLTSCALCVVPRHQIIYCSGVKAAVLSSIDDTLDTVLSFTATTMSL